MFVSVRKYRGPDTARNELVDHPRTPKSCYKNANRGWFGGKKERALLQFGCPSVERHCMGYMKMFASFRKCLGIDTT